MVRSYDLLRSMWRGVVGVDGGNVDVSRNKRVARSAARLACYLSKYISKGFSEALSTGDSYRASGRALPSAVVLRSLHVSLFAAFAELEDLLAYERAGSKVFHACTLN